VFGHPVTLEATYHCIVMVKFAHFTCIMLNMFMILSNMFNYVHLVGVDLVWFGLVQFGAVQFAFFKVYFNQQQEWKIRLGILNWMILNRHTNRVLVYFCKLYDRSWR